MGCTIGKAEESVRSAVGPASPKGRRDATNVSGRISLVTAQDTASQDVEILVRRLEKLDEERHMIQQQLNRAHNAVELGDGTISEELDMATVRRMPPARQRERARAGRCPPWSGRWEMQVPGWVVCRCCSGIPAPAGALLAPGPARHGRSFVTPPPTHTSHPPCPFSLRRALPAVHCFLREAGHS
jgi:uncharacterized protein (UPF0335 family)